MHWLLCKKFPIDCNEKWFLHEPEPVQEKERWKLLWDFTIQTDKVLEHRRPDIVVIDKEKKNALLLILQYQEIKTSQPKMDLLRVYLLVTSIFW